MRRALLTCSIGDLNIDGGSTEWLQASVITSLFEIMFHGSTVPPKRCAQVAVALSMLDLREEGRLDVGAPAAVRSSSAGSGSGACSCACKSHEQSC